MDALGLIVAAAVGIGAFGFGRGRAPMAEPGLSLERPSPLPGTPPTGQDARDIRTFDGWVDHPGYAVTPAQILAVFREAERGYPQRQCDLVDDLVENDGHLRNLLEQREQAVAGKPWVIQADGSDGDSEQAARVLSEAMRRLPLIQVFQHLLGSNRYGYAAAEIDWGIAVVEGAAWIVPTWIAPVPARRFRIATDMTSPGALDELRLYTDAKRPQGDALRPGKWIVMRRSGTWLARAGLMRTAAWPAAAKRLGFRDWLIYSQRFGLPMPIVSYDPEVVDDDGIATAEEIVRRIGSDGGAVVPNHLKLDFHDATKGGENSKAHGGLIAHCNAEMSKLINGSTLSNDSTGSGGASYALGEVHATVRWDNVLFDAESLQEAFRTQLFAAFMHFNNLRGKPPLLKVQVVRDLDPKARVEIADVMQNKLGIDVSKSQMRQELGFREPTGADDTAPGAPKSSTADGKPALPSGGDA